MAFAFKEMGFKCVNYIDDLDRAEAPSQAMVAFDYLSILLQDLGLKESLDKVCAPATTMIFLGIQFDTIAATLTIPPAKLQEIVHVLADWVGKDKANKKSCSPW